MCESWTVVVWQSFIHQTFHICHIRTTWLLTEWFMVQNSIWRTVECWLMVPICSFYSVFNTVLFNVRRNYNGLYCTQSLAQSYQYNLEFFRKKLPKIVKSVASRNHGWRWKKCTREEKNILLENKLNLFILLYLDNEMPAAFSETRWKHSIQTFFIRCLFKCLNICLCPVKLSFFFFFFWDNER